MSKPFDSTLNTLIDDHVADWTAFLCGRLGVPPSRSEVLDTDLSTTAQADKLFRVEGPPTGLLHLELESGGRLGIPGELHRYNVLAQYVNDLPVHSFVFLLRPKATATDLTGHYEVRGLDGELIHTFRYHVVRVWQEPIEGFLWAGVGLAPLSLITNEAVANPEPAFTRFRDRLRAANLPRNVEESLLGSTFVLCGLRYTAEQVERLYRSVSMLLEDSTTYQLLVQKGETKGRLAGAREVLLAIAGERFGPPTPEIEQVITGIADPARLHRISARVLHATDWPDLLATT